MEIVSIGAETGPTKKTVRHKVREVSRAVTIHVPNRCFMGIVLFAFCLVGCSSVRPLPPVGALTQLGSGTINLPDSQRIKANLIRVEGDSISFRESRSGRTQILERNQVDTILIVNRWTGFWHGFGFGFAVGGLTGILAASAISSDCNPNISGECLTATMDGALAGIALHGLGMWTGAIYGAVRGNKVYYTRNYTPPTRAPARHSARPAKPSRPG
jgi:hypothetical protein